jgi:hypothetical protein
MRALDMTGGSISRHTHAADTLRFVAQPATILQTPAAPAAPAQPNWRVAPSAASLSVIAKNSATVSSMMA